MQVVQTIGQEIMSCCNPDDTSDIHLKLHEITSSFNKIEQMAKLQLEELNKTKVKAEYHKKLVYELDSWLEDNGAIIQQWEDLPIDGSMLEQQIDEIKVA